MIPCFVCYFGPMEPDGSGGYECQNDKCGAFIRWESIVVLGELGVTQWWYYMHEHARGR